MSCHCFAILTSGHFMLLINNNQRFQYLSVKLTTLITLSSYRKRQQQQTNQTTHRFTHICSNSMPAYVQISTHTSIYLTRYIYMICRKCKHVCSHCIHAENITLLILSVCSCNTCSLSMMAMGK